MATPTFEQLLEAGCHFGHLKRKWNPAMEPYIFMERNGIHIIDLYKTAAKIDEAAQALKQLAKTGNTCMRKDDVLFTTLMYTGSVTFPRWMK